VDGKEPLTVSHLLELHKLILTRLDDENAGRFRRVPVRIAGSTHVPPNAMKVPELIDAMLERYRRDAATFHPVLVAADLHERIAGIHPFVDGNGRTARLVMNLHLLQNGFPLTIVSAERPRRLAYYQALEDTLQPEMFRQFTIERVEESLRSYIELLG